MKKLLFFIECFILLLTLNSCGSIGKHTLVWATKDSYDGKKKLHMTTEPVSYNYEGKRERGNLYLGLVKSSEMKKDEVELIVKILDIKNFSFEHPNFFVMIDGKETKLSPTTKETGCDTSSPPASCYQYYLIKIGFLEKMVNAKEVKFKLFTTDTIYMGSLYTRKKDPNSVKAGFIEFLSKYKAEFNITP